MSGCSITVVMPPAAADMVPVVKSSRSVWPGILEVGVHVDRAGHHDEPGRVDQLVGAVAAAPGSAIAATRPSSITTSAANTP